MASTLSIFALGISAITLFLSVRQAARNKQMHNWTKDERETGGRRWSIERDPDQPTLITLRNNGTTEVRNVTIDDGDGHPLVEESLKPGHITCFEIAPATLAHPATIATITWNVPGERDPREYQIRD